MGGTGLEQVAELSKNRADGGQGGAECGALDARDVVNDPGLAGVVEAWPKLPEAIKAGIVAMIKAAM